MILGIDPGKSHYAWAAIEQDGTVKAVGMLQTPISELVDPHLTRMARAHRLEVQALLRRYQPTAIAVERYEIRTGPGAKGQSGAAVEYVNCMIGALLMLCQDPFVPVHPVPARQWKVWLAGATTGGKTLESAAGVLGINVTKAQTAVPITDHGCDAVGQGLWLLGQGKQGYDAKALVDRAKASLQEIWAAGKK